jgi:hypothetical protein
MPEQESFLDIIVRRDGDTRWTLTDLLGRAMGYIEKSLDDKYLIHPAGSAEATMASLTREQYLSLDKALADIEKHTRSAVRHTPY